MGGNLHLLTGIFSAGGRVEPFEDYYNISSTVARSCVSPGGAWRTAELDWGGMHMATIGTGPVQGGAYCTSPGVLTGLVSRLVRG